jgi:trk system potassium uptake protein TrkH
MLDLRPVGYVIGLLTATLGVAMLVPLLVDLAEAKGHWPVFAQSSVICILAGGLIALACSNGVKEGLSIQQTFLLTTSVWLALPFFGAIPFMIGATEARFVDAFFEAMSGLTTTGSTVFSGLEQLPKGILLWRGILQWLGGIGIIIVAMVFLPELRVGGMQIFKSEAFDTMGKILPRATEIASQISSIYIGLTMACALTYLALGMNAFDATVHAMTSVATGGFANYDTSFAAFQGGHEYAASLFMVLAALPFVRYVQLLNGEAQPIWRDSQVRAFILTLMVIVVVMALALASSSDRPFPQAFRQSLFNVTSIMTGTGYASDDYMTWGPFLVSMFFFIGLIGGCAGSTTCSIKVFRYQLLFASIKMQLRRIRSPNGVFVVRYEKRPVDEDVLGSVMSFFMFFVVSLGLLAVALSFTGLDFITAVSGAATALSNIGPGLGPEIGPAGNFAGLNDAAKWLLSLGMLLGRLELVAVFAILTIKFWRD